MFPCSANKDGNDISIHTRMYCIIHYDDVIISFGVYVFWALYWWKVLIFTDNNWLTVRGVFSVCSDNLCGYPSEFAIYTLEKQYHDLSQKGPFLPKETGHYRYIKRCVLWPWSYCWSITYYIVITNINKYWVSRMPLNRPWKVPFTYSQTYQNIMHRNMSWAHHWSAQRPILIGWG